MADLIVGIYGGVDTHKDLHVAAVVDQTGRVLGTESFAANPAGYRRLESWICAFGESFHAIPITETRAL